MNLNKLYTTKKSNYQKPSFLKILVLLFFGTAFLQGLWEGITDPEGSSQSQTVETGKQSTKVDETSSESTTATQDSSKVAESTTKTTESTKVEEPKKMPVSPNAMNTFADKLQADLVNFMNESGVLSESPDDVNALQGSVDNLQSILDDLNSLDPVSVLHGGDFKNSADYDTVVLYMQTPIDRMTRNVQATIDLTQAYIDGTATQDSLDTFTSLTHDAQTIPSDIESIRGMAANKDLFN